MHPNELQEAIEHEQRLLEQYIRNLRKLQETAALHGMDVPLKLRNDIEREEANIAASRQRLG
jgi:hypothetical protein